MSIYIPRTFRDAFQSMILSLVTCWMCAVIITRLYAFHNAYMQHLNKIEDEAWLRNNCRDPDFFSNLRQHTEICTAVMENFRKSPVLVALNDVAASTYLCGSQTCLGLFQDISRGGLPLIGCLLLFFVFTPSFIIPFIRMGVDHAMEQRVLRACSAIYDKPKTRSTKWQHSWLTQQPSHFIDLQDPYQDNFMPASGPTLKKIV